MCGISGYLAPKKKVDVSVLKKMTDMIAYRGPDDEGFVLLNEESVVYARGKDSVKEVSHPPIETYLEEKDICLGMGHRRLSIQDLSVLGHQPMEKHGRILVFNGEIYNYIEIREELAKRGYQFTSRCDTEVILSAYDYWGAECVQHFNGMWALAIYDGKKQEIFLSRDRFGVKPLYYYMDEEKLLFASEIKQILCDNSVPALVEEEILAHYLRYNFREYSDKTFFKNIYALQGGCNAVIHFDLENETLGKLIINRYYDLRKAINGVDVKNPAEYIGEELKNAIHLRMRSDVKVGSCLSGGMDSSSIVGIICHELKEAGEDTKNFSTVTSAFPQDKEIDETYYSRRVIDFCGCEENLVKPDIKSMMANLENSVWHQDEPLPHLGNEVSYAVFHKAAEVGCKVFFDGQGGDEGLGGYYFYYANYLWDILKTQGILKFIHEFRRIVNSSGLSIIEAIEFLFYFNFPVMRHFLTAFRRDKYMSKRIIRNINLDNIQMFFDAKDTENRQIDDFLYGSLPSILHWEDRNSMASSVETRLPFLDYKYVEKVLAVNISDKMKNGYTKAPLRDYVEKILPQEVVWRKSKLGFPAPTRRWLMQMPQDFVLNLLDHAVSYPFFNISKLRKAYLRGKGKLDMVEKFIVVELWMRIFNISVENSARS